MELLSGGTCSKELDVINIDKGKKKKGLKWLEGIWMREVRE